MPESDGIVDGLDHTVERRIRIDHYLHFDGPVRIELGADITGALSGGLSITLVEPTPPAPVPTHAVLSIIVPNQGANMSSSIDISVDDTSAIAVLTFEDDHGDRTNPPLSADGVTPAVVAYTSDNTAVATVDPSTGALTEVSAGTVNIGATVNDASTGQPVLEPDGVTPFAPSPVNVTVTPGVAATDVFTVTP